MSTVLPMPGWESQAACRHADPDLFFGPDTEPPHLTAIREATARKFCARCPVTQACQAAADEQQTRFGVWGGETELARQRRIAQSHKEAC